MSSRYTYATTLSFGQDGEPGYCELDVEVSYRVLWGRPETPPAYSHGGLPADPDEVDDVRLELIDGKPRPWDLTWALGSEAETIAIIEDRFGDLWCELIEEARSREGAWAE